MICPDCKCEVLDYFSVGFTTEDGSVSICSDCFNKRIGRMYDIEIMKVKQRSFLLEDQSRNKHFFRVKKIIVPTGFLLKAQEFIDDEPKGYVFDVHGEVDCDQIKLEDDLLKKVKEGLAYQSTEKSDISGDVLKEKVCGRIESNVDCDSTGPIMLIDGKEYTWEAFGEMLMMYEGWKFKLELE